VGKWWHRELSAIQDFVSALLMLMHTAASACWGHCCLEKVQQQKMSGNTWTHFARVSQA
jgi:hypothetical protein